VVFGSSIAESINHAVRILGNDGVILATGAERSSVLEAARAVGSLELIELDHDGHVDFEALEGRLRAGGVTMLCAQVANHETGVLGDAARAVELAHAYGATAHVDATIGFGRLPLDLEALGADATTVASELLGGPQGTSALIVRRGSVLKPFLLGGAQERARRAGLENLLGIIGFGVAAEVLAQPGALEAEAAAQRELLTRLVECALQVPGVRAVGDADPHRRAGWLRCFTIDGIEAEGVVMGLDRVGVSVHSGSACSAESLEPSAVLAAMGIEADRSLRLSVGWSSTESEVERFEAHFAGVIERLRSLRS
jgi:cysteine desulfurase